MDRQTSRNLLVFLPVKTAVTIALSTGQPDLHFNPEIPPPEVDTGSSSATGTDQSAQAVPHLAPSSGTSSLRRPGRCMLCTS